MAFRISLQKATTIHTHKVDTIYLVGAQSAFFSGVIFLLVHFIMFCFIIIRLEFPEAIFGRNFDND